MNKMETNSPAMEEEYRPAIVEEEQMSMLVVVPQQIKIFIEHDLRGLIHKHIDLEELLKANHMHEFCYQSFAYNVAQVSKFAQNYTKGITRVQGKEIMVNKQILSKATYGLGTRKVWGKK